MEISLCMIVKNEEKCLARCLNCVKDIVDEIVIVDTGSTDHTKEIAYQFTDKVYDYEWIDNFSDARNFSFSKATKPYMMWLDADDILLEKDQLELKKLKQNLLPEVDMVMMKYFTAFDKEGNPTFSYYRERIMAKRMNYQWER